ncbi:hypothetical protein GIB67_036183 [Kingdonia uniflora]|uniref:Protein kinase domain-containing protein n=1 Tax=Kingdonia uniflora TaxID=39325 RepID=A0A7J7N9F5_9MAGN|nr:hypothetical protein GIB67_036183 [Kingdonia uniflora]
MHNISLATDNFSDDRIIGDGSFGLVYKAQLPNGLTVAVKKLDKDAFQGVREFTAEMETLGKNRVRHPNLVRILGYCVSGDDRILIYEFMERGCLDQWIHEHSDDCTTFVLPWDTRAKIIKGVAKGLSFLHTSDTPIIHRDIKASNVLLDHEFEAHIADFGLARQVLWSHSHVSTQIAGTMGYMPPEYRSGVTAATVKHDVYSFGILMIEVASGRRPNWPVKMEDGTSTALVEWAMIMVAEERHMEMIDSSMSKEGLKETEVREYFRIAFSCTNETNRERPSMEKVVTLLDEL